MCVFIAADEMGKHAQSTVMNEHVLAVWPGALQREDPTLLSAAVEVFDIGVKKIN